MKPKSILAIVVIVLFLLILVQNTQAVTLRLYFWKISMSQIILIPLTMLIGWPLGYIFAKMMGQRYKGKARE